MMSANAMWGLMSPVSKAVLVFGPISAFSLTAFRVVGAAVAFWIASLFFPKERVSPRDLAQLFVAGLFAIILNQGSFVMGVSLTSPIDASIVTTTLPIITLIMSAVYLKERITGQKILGISLGASGALLLVLSGHQAIAGNHGQSNIFGDLLCLFAQCSFAVYLVLFKKLMGRYSSVTLMKWMFTFAALVWLPISFNQLKDIPFASLPTHIYGGIIYVVLIGTFVTYFLLSVGQSTLRPTTISMYNYVQPIVSALVTIWWGMDVFSWIKGLAVVLIFTGVYIVTQSKAETKSQLSH
jgi:drug/metabolite transporter (DMT)-like permease